MVKNSEVQWKRLSMRVAVRQAIQLEFIKQLRMKDLSFENNQKEPHGIISEVTANVNKQKYGQEKFKVSRQYVSYWIAKVRNNEYQLTQVTPDYSKSSQSRRKFHEDEQRRIREKVFNGELKCGEVVTVYSDKEGQEISVSKSSVWRALKRKLL